MPESIPVAWLPGVLRRLANDEFPAPPLSSLQAAARAQLERGAPDRARRLGLSLVGYLASPLGTASSLRAVDLAAGGGYYDVPASAELDRDEARAALGGPDFVVDVQTHYVSSAGARTRGAEGVLQFIQSVAPDRYRELGGGALALSIAEFLRCVFVESETRVAVLTAAPGEAEHNILPNAEIAGTRELVDRLAGSGRLLHHAIVHPNLPGELDQLDSIVARHRPAGFKVYTLFGAGSAGAERGWMLDDEACGIPFLTRAQALGVRIICAHKGLAGLAPTSSPRDVGPAAAFPGLDFLVYHSGYEISPAGHEEGAYSEASAQWGTDRLVRSLREAGVGPGANVYAELGSTWYLLMSRPREAAHVLGKLLLAVGEDNVLWGSDSPWYGPTQHLIDAFRAFHIPEALCERHGYPRLTPTRKAKILGANAARVYGIDRDAETPRAADDELDWVREAVAEAGRRGSLALA